MILLFLRAARPSWVQSLIDYSLLLKEMHRLCLIFHLQCLELKPILRIQYEAYPLFTKHCFKKGSKSPSVKNLKSLKIQAKVSTPSWVVDDWYNEYWGHKYGESDFSTCTGHFTQVGRYSSWIAERQILITANIRILQSKILCIFSACVERNQKGGLCYGWKVPLQGKKGQIQKGQVGIHIFFCLLIIDGCL